MNTDTSNTLLKDLFELLGDSRKAYDEAAEKIKNPKFVSFMNKLSQERGEMQAELGLAMQLLYPTHQRLKEGTIKGELHREWIDISEAMAKSEEAAVLVECRRGEGYLRTCYSTVIEDKSTPRPVAILLRRQMTYIDVTLSTIEQLQAALK